MHAFLFLAMTGFLLATAGAPVLHPQVTTGNTCPSSQKSLVPSYFPENHSFKAIPARWASLVRELSQGTPFTTCFSSCGHQRAPVHLLSCSPLSSPGNAFC